MRLFGSLSVFPPAVEVAWYATIWTLRRWVDLPEEEFIKRAEAVARRLACVLGAHSKEFLAMVRGLAQTVYYRTHGIQIRDRLDAHSLRRWRDFQHEARLVSRAVFVGAHLGPFQHQMDVLAELPHQILCLFRSYRWPPLAREMDRLRRLESHLTYMDVRRTRQILCELKAGRSIALLGDSAGHGTLNLFGRPALDDFPVRLALRLRIPVFVGGIYNHPATPAGSTASFGFDYHRVDPASPPTARQNYAAAMERTISNNPSDWIHFS